MCYVSFPTERNSSLWALRTHAPPLRLSACRWQDGSKGGAKRGIFSLVGTTKGGPGGLATVQHHTRSSSEGITTLRRTSYYVCIVLVCRQATGRSKLSNNFIRFVACVFRMNPLRSSADKMIISDCHTHARKFKLVTSLICIGKKPWRLTVRVFFIHLGCFLCGCRQTSPRVVVFAVKFSSLFFLVAVFVGEGSSNGSAAT